MDRAKRIKQEPPDPDDEGPRCPKQAASPAQEATRARISNLEAQLKKLCKLKSTGKLDAKGAFQIRCLEEDLRKSQSKLRRLLNEAERQRRRRERLRGAPREQQSTDDSVMAALKSCTRFQDFVRELNSLGFNLTRQDEQIDDNEVMPEVDVQVELIEGDGEFPSDVKIDNTTTASSEQSQPRIVLGKDEEQDKWRQESYRQWFERQTELQQRWEEGFMREQMELARSLLESVTATFLQGVQQVLSNVTSGRRFPPFCPESPS